MKEKKYEVSFVVYGYTEESLAPIGSAEASDEYKNEDGTFSLVDCRANYCIRATSPEAAYNKAVDKFEEDDFGELEITDWNLEHVYRESDDRYWSIEELDL